MFKKNKSLIISIIGLFGLIAITVGVTFAFFNYAKEGTTDNTITTGTITFLYTEVSGVGKGISLIDSYPISDSQGKNLTGEGKIKALDPVLSPSSRSRFVEAEIPNKKGEWLSGSFVSLTVPLAAEVKPSISVPAEAITLDDKGAYLFVLQNGKAKKTYVTTALRTPISVTVTDGLSEGDTIAVSGLMNMRDGSSVEVKSLRNKDNYEVQE